MRNAMRERVRERRTEFSVFMLISQKADLSGCVHKLYLERRVPFD